MIPLESPFYQDDWLKIEESDAYGYYHQANREMDSCAGTHSRRKLGMLLMKEAKRQPAWNTSDGVKALTKNELRLAVPSCHVAVM